MSLSRLSENSPYCSIDFNHNSNCHNVHIFVCLTSVITVTRTSVITVRNVSEAGNHFAAQNLILVAQVVATAWKNSFEDFAIFFGKTNAERF